MSSSILFLGAGKMSTFGGPDDKGVGPNEGLALFGKADLATPSVALLFLPTQPPDTTGVARRLNPRAYYCAMRWDEVLKKFGMDYDGDYHVTHTLRQAMVRLTNPSTKACLFARPVDYGPGDGKVVDGQLDPDTGRIADLSPQAATDLGLVTDDMVTCELILPEVES